MARPKRCKICTCPDVGITSQVNSLIEAGVKQRTIHEQHPQFSISQISRHSRFCLAVNVATELTPNTGSAEITKWLERAETTYLTAQVNGDARSAVSAISTAVRSLSQLQKQLAHEAETEKDGVDRDSVEFTAKGIDALLRHEAERGTIQNGLTPRTMTLLTEEPAFAQIVQAVWANRSILPALLLCCDEHYFPERETTNANS